MEEEYARGIPVSDKYYELNQRAVECQFYNINTKIRSKSGLYGYHKNRIVTNALKVANDRILPYEEKLWDHWLAFEATHVRERLEDKAGRRCIHDLDIKEYPFIEPED